MPFLGAPVMRFVAEAIGPKGRYVAAKSTNFLGEKFAGKAYTPALKSKQYDEAKWALDVLVDHLAHDGWDYQGMHGRSWWEMQMSRVAR